MKSKTIWVVNYDDVNQFLDKAVKIGATAVAIRTDNDMVKAINAFHAKGIKVFGWRWPSAKADPAMNEAKKVVALFGKGLDGYYVDPERKPGKPYDWDQPGLDSLADTFCKAIVSSMQGDQVFGVTSHYRANKVFPKLPWAAFFKHSTVFLPQAYWRSDGGIIGHGEPQDNYDKSIEAWKAAGAPVERIVPMAGELTHATAAEIAAYAAAANAKAIESLHFYAYADSVKSSVWNAVAQA
ncbi:hypothetical protein P0D73_45025 [Paraburkholderia sp. RL18-101-BIB-B]|uniref:hypothetical protein n=1 Tax=Paraburkholderia sp. RL18-101-BIB-B TaxID=3031634 RepID=UPI0038BD9C37